MNRVAKDREEGVKMRLKILQVCYFLSCPRIITGNNLGMRR